MPRTACSTSSSGCRARRERIRQRLHLRGRQLGVERPEVFVDPLNALRARDCNDIVALRQLHMLHLGGPEPVAETPVIDLMEALRRSVEDAKQAKQATAKKAAPAKKAMSSSMAAPSAMPSAPAKTALSPQAAWPFPTGSKP